MRKIKKVLGVLSLWIGLFVIPSSAFAATLSLNPSGGVINKGCEVSLKVELDTQGVQTDGTDVIVIYNPAQMSITTSNIVNGTIYPEYPGNSVDSAQGRLSVSGISSISSTYSGSGTLATLKFTVANTLADGTPISVKFDFDPNNKTKTTDSNVVERGTIADVLSAVTDGNYTVGTGPCPANGGVNGGQGAGGRGQVGNGLPGSGGTASGSAQFPVYTPPPGQLPSAGLFDNTIAITAFGLTLVVLGIAGLAIL